LISKWLWGKLKDILTSGITVAVLVAIIAALAQRWFTEMGEHEKTRGELAGEKASNESGIVERNRLRMGLAALQKDNADFKKLHPILNFYGPRAKFIASYDLKKEIGSKLAIGNCPGEPCIQLMLRSMIKDLAGRPIAILGVGGNWEGNVDPDISFGFPLAMIRGCRGIFEAGPYQITFVIEEDRLTDIKAGVGISILGRFQVGIRTVGSDCPNE
jgi:hypothetical protein